MVIKYPAILHHVRDTCTMVPVHIVFEDGKMPFAVIFPRDRDGHMECRNITNSMTAMGISFPEKPHMRRVMKYDAYLGEDNRLRAVHFYSPWLSVVATTMHDARETMVLTSNAKHGWPMCEPLGIQFHELDPYKARLN